MITIFRNIVGVIGEKFVLFFASIFAIFLGVKIIQKGAADEKENEIKADAAESFKEELDILREVKSENSNDSASDAADKLRE